MAENQFKTSGFNLSEHFSVNLHVGATLAFVFTKTPLKTNLISQIVFFNEFLNKGCIKAVSPAEAGTAHTDGNFGHFFASSISSFLLKTFYHEKRQRAEKRCLF